MDNLYFNDDTFLNTVIISNFTVSVTDRKKKKKKPS